MNLSVSIGKLTLQNPVMVASGTFGYGVEYARLIDLNQLGAVVVKGIRLTPVRGNPTPRTAEVTSGMLNAIGLQGPGVDGFIEKYWPFLKSLRVPAIINIWGTTVEEYAEVARRFDALGGVGALELNVSCPNIKEGGVSFGIDPCAIEKIVTGVKAAVPRGRAVTIITKLTPNITDITVPAKAAIAAGTDALSMINTLRGVAIDIRAKKPYFANVAAGLSGPAVKPVGLCMVWDCFAKIPECRSRKIPIIGIGGISTWQDAVEYLLAGATAVQVGTAWFVNPALFVEMKQGLLKYLEREQATVSQLTGQAHG